LWHTLRPMLSSVQTEPGSVIAEEDGTNDQPTAGVREQAMGYQQGSAAAASASMAVARLSALCTVLTNIGPLKPAFRDAKFISSHLTAYLLTHVQHTPYSICSKNHYACRCSAALSRVVLKWHRHYNPDMDKRHSFVQRNGSGRWRPKHGGDPGGDSNPLVLPPETLQQIQGTGCGARCQQLMHIRPTAARWGAQ